MKRESASSPWQRAPTSQGRRPLRPVPPLRRPPKLYDTWPTHHFSRGYFASSADVVRMWPWLRRWLPLVQCICQFKFVKWVQAGCGLQVVMWLRRDNNGQSDALQSARRAPHRRRRQLGHIFDKVTLFANQLFTFSYYIRIPAASSFCLAQINVRDFP